MKMLRVTSLDDYDKLPMTSWNIKQPISKGISLHMIITSRSSGDEEREDALRVGLDLIITPGLGFTKVCFDHMILVIDHMIHNNNRKEKE